MSVYFNENYPYAAQWLRNLIAAGPGVFPLAHGVSAQVGRLRGYGNAIVPPLAAEFITACRETGIG